MSTISIVELDEATNASATLSGDVQPSALGWNATPAPLDTEPYTPCKRRWNGFSTVEKYVSTPCAATVLPFKSAARPKILSEALLVRSVTEIVGEKNILSTVVVSAIMITRPAPEVFPSPNPIQLRVPL